MRTAEARDRMVARVHAAFKTHPRFEGWPKVKAPSAALLAEVQTPVTEESYLAALYEICAVGKPTGRAGGALVGRRTEDRAAPVEGKRLVAERGKIA